MTEREKRIEEMAIVIADKQNCKRPNYNCSYRTYCTAYKIAQDIYDAGYRKADEVRKETARAMLKRFIQAVQDEAGCLFGKIRGRCDQANLTTIDRFVDIVEIVADDFGMEV